MSTESPLVESAGASLLKALIGEIRQLPKPWEQISERDQEVVIDRLRRAVESVVRSTVAAVAGGTFPRIPAVVESLGIKDGVKVVLKVAKGHADWHALADATGGQAMIVLASAQEYLEGVQSIRPDPDQREMFNGDEPSSDAQESWQAVIELLEKGSPDESGEQAEAPPAEPKSIGQQVHDLLAAVYVYVPIETCEGWTEQECTVAAYWAIQYAKNPDTAPARPHWLPLPQVPEIDTTAPDSDGGEQQADGEQGSDADCAGPDAPPPKRRRRGRGNGELRPN